MTRDGSAQTRLARRAAIRLGLHAALLGSAIAVLLTATAVVVVSGSQARAARTELDAALAAADDVIDPPTGIWLAILGPSGLASTPGLPSGLPERDELAMAARGEAVPPCQVKIDGVEYWVETLGRADGTAVQAILDLRANHAERDRLVTTMLVSGSICLLVAALAGGWLGQRALRPLTAALALQRRFVADAGHELRTPVTLLHTRVQLLRRRMLAAGEQAPPTAQVMADLDGVVADSARLGAILEELLLAADPLAAQERLPVDLVEVARSVLAAAGAAAAERGVRLGGPEPGTPQAVVTGAPVALRRALTALVDNAVRHAAGQVVLSVTAERGHVDVDVRDDGPGVDPELAERLFDRFVAGRPTPTDGRRRYGLGLAMVNEIAQAHRGRVELVDHDGPGALIRIRLSRE